MMYRTEMVSLKVLKTSNDLNIGKWKTILSDLSSLGNRTIMQNINNENNLSIGLNVLMSWSEMLNKVRHSCSSVGFEDTDRAN